MKTKLWQWPNLLGLDAAAIALIWQGTFASKLSSGPGFSSYIVLGLSVWLTYQADRLFDTANRSEAQLESARHQFAKRNHGLIWRIWFGVLALNLLAACFGLSIEQLSKGSFLLAVCLIYTWLTQKLSKRFFPKELFVALIFTGGTHVFLPETADRLSTLSFALLCFVNCVIIAQKEKSIDAQLGVRSLSSVIGNRALHALFAIAIICSLFAGYSATLFPCALCLTLLQLQRHHFNTEQFRVLCDASLLVGPALYFLFSGAFVR